MDNLLLEIDDLDRSELIKLYKYLKDVVENVDTNIVIADTGYVSRLAREDNRHDFKEWCTGEGVEPIMLIDSLWGDGIYLFEGSEVRVFPYNSKSTQKKIECAENFPEDLKELLSNFGSYGRVFFRAPAYWNPTNLLKEMDYCCIFDLLDTQKEYLEDSIVTIYNYDTESG